MRRAVSVALGALLALSCGDSDVIEGVTDECTLDPIVEARIVRGAIDCSPERDSLYPVPLYIAIEQPEDEDAIIQGIREAMESHDELVRTSFL